MNYNLRAKKSPYPHVRFYFTTKLIFLQDFFTTFRLISKLYKERHYKQVFLYNFGNFYFRLFHQAKVLWEIYCNLHKFPHKQVRQVFHLFRLSALQYPWCLRRCRHLQVFYTLRHLQSGFGRHCAECVKSFFAHSEHLVLNFVCIRANTAVKTSLARSRR